MIYNWYINLLLKVRGAERPKSRLKRKFGGFMLNYAPGLLNCRQFDAHLPEFLEGGLPKKTERAFHSHKLLCPMCRAHFSTLTASIAFNKEMFEKVSHKNAPEISPELVVQIVDVLQSMQLPGE